MSIVKKIVVGYFFIIFIPVIVVGALFYNQIYGSLVSQFADNRQNILEQAYSNLKTDLARIESVYRILQYNAYVTDYLDGVFDSESESVYTHLRYIDPLFSQSMAINPEMKSMVIYKLKDQVLSIPERFVDRAALNPKVLSAVATLKPGKGKWIRLSEEGATPSYSYYQYLYNSRYTEKIGLLEIRVGDEMIRQFLKAAGVGEHWRALFFNPEGDRLPLEPVSADAVFESEDRMLAGLAADRTIESDFIYHRTIVNQMFLKELGVRVLIAGQVSDVFERSRNREIVLVAIIIALLVLLSVLYYSFASSIAKRILKLARHMRAVSDSNLKLVTNSQSDKDEIGFLTLSYNAMIQRLDELINHVHRAELRNKEIAYKVLQAQIKPHFLYNTLETIRMMAEANDDKEVADISYSFARLMRYSLSSQKDDTVLSAEIEMVAYYLNIHQARLGDRLEVEFDIRLDEESVPCPRFMLQPLVENCIVHGASTVLRPVRILLFAEETGDEFRIVLTDNGAGIAWDNLKDIRALLAFGSDAKGNLDDEGDSLGLYNVSERIKTFYGGTSRIELESEEGKGTTLTLYLSKGTVSLQ
ncbi:sensor histidine kinase [Paenibacillus sp. sptzw28]|uniref:sensor histidine kinase n=1 Tax=Paenibacillus sp. sptzw28 TaxID=715179 RepID=UPI001C6EA593|nr:sensor histidine kinase [Paenibacillus sp. sptzw28]QYR20304.1 sensor histidine kinase [Paenibacillus sp. sptzw28]